MNDITHELARIVEGLRWCADTGEPVNRGFLTRVDAILDRYEDACKTPEKPKMKINLKEYAGKLVVVTLRNEWMIVSNVIFNEGPDYDTYIIDGKYYSDYGKVFGYDVASPYDIVDIALAEKGSCETPENPSMTNCVVEGEPPNGCRAWNVWYEEFGSRGILNNLKISSLNNKPEPVITRVEVITDKREYVNWNKNNVITTSLQDGGKTLKVFITKNTEEPEMPITKPEFYIEPEVIEDLWTITANYKTFAKSIADMMSSSTKESVSNKWATALSGLIDKLGGDSPALWEWKGITPTPEKVVECLQELVDFHMSIAADNELEACCEWLKGIRGPMKITGVDDPFMVSVSLRNARRPTLKSQALKDFETVRKHSDLLPEILDTIENALKSLPDT